MIIFSDLHLEPKSRDTALAVLERIPEECNRHGDHHVVMLGDFWMVRHTLSARLLLEAHDRLRAWRPAVKRCDVVPGNHDQVENSGRNALEVFDNLEGFNVHTEATRNEHGFFLPWRSPVEQRVILDAWARDGGDSPPVLFAHAAVDGAWMNNLHKLEAGHGIVVDDIVNAGFKHAFLGHYHRHQLLRKGMMYVGSPYEVSYAEAGQPKGFVRWDGKRAEFHELDIGPKHHKVVIDADHPEKTIALPHPDEAGRIKLWVEVRGQSAGVMRDAVERTLAQAGIDAERIDIDLQPTTDAARLQLTANDTIESLAMQYLDAQDMPDDYKALLRETFARLA
jgi:DNA repair exonuclease SbcCD nuclease subunit